LGQLLSCPAAADTRTNNYRIKPVTRHVVFSTLKPKSQKMQSNWVALICVMVELAIYWRILFNNVKLLWQKSIKLKKQEDKMHHFSNKFHIVSIADHHLI